MIGRPFSQQDDDGIAGGAAFDVCDCVPGLIAPLWTSVADTPPGLIDGTAAPPETGDCALAVVVWPPPASN